LAPDLEKSKLLTQRDALTLGIACEVGAFAQAAAATLHAEGVTTTDAAHKDTERRSPTWVVFTQAAAQWLAYAGALGLSPKARESLTMQQQGPADAFAAYMRRGAAIRAGQDPVEAEEW
jgi:P27 family predicted phage terminase small subunit